MPIARQGAGEVGGVRGKQGGLAGGLVHDSRSDAVGGAQPGSEWRGGQGRVFVTALCRGQGAGLGGGKSGGRGGSKPSGRSGWGDRARGEKTGGGGATLARSDNMYGGGGFWCVWGGEGGGVSEGWVVPVGGGCGGEVWGGAGYTGRRVIRFQ